MMDQMKATATRSERKQLLKYDSEVQEGAANGRFGRVVIVGYQWFVNEEPRLECRLVATPGEVER